MSSALKFFVAGINFFGILCSINSLSAISAEVQTPIGGVGAHVGNGVGASANVGGLGAEVQAGYTNPDDRRYDEGYYDSGLQNSGNVYDVNASGYRSDYITPEHDPQNDYFRRPYDSGKHSR